MNNNQNRLSLLKDEEENDDVIRIQYDPSMPNEDDIAQMISTVPPGDRAYTLFLGAGASVNSEIPSADGMVEKWKRDLYDKTKKKNSANDFKSWEEEIYPAWLDDWKKKIREPNEKEYGALFRYFHKQPRQRQLYIETIIDGKEPTFGYLYLSGIISENRFNRILTTNFDDLLSDSLFRYYDRKAVVAAFDSSVTSFRIESTRPKIIKLHGDFLYDNLKNISQELKSLDTVMEEKLYQVCKDSGLIVVGYSGRDESIMAPLRDMVRKAQYLNMGLHWCVLEPKDDSQEIEIPSMLYDIYKNHEDKVHIYAIKGFDELMECIFIKCECKLPKILEFPEEINICNKFDSAVRRGTNSNLTDTMNFHLHLFLEKASKNEINVETIAKLAETERNAAVNALNSGNYINCENNLKKCEAHLVEIDNAIDVPDTIKAKSIKIKSGVYLAFADLYYQQKNENHLIYLEKAIDITNHGKILFSNNLNIEKGIRQTYYYNLCCAYGLKKRFTGLISKQEEEIVKNEIESIQILDIEGKEISELYKDPDFSGLLYLLSKN